MKISIPIWEYAGILFAAFAVGFYLAFLTATFVRGRKAESADSRPWPGIRLRISYQGTRYFENDSFNLALMALARRPVCLPSCSPACASHHWVEVFPGEGTAFAPTARDFRIECLPIDY